MPDNVETTEIIENLDNENFDDSGINIEDEITVGGSETIENENIDDVPISNEDFSEQIVQTENENNNLAVPFENFDALIERLNDELAGKILVILSNLEQESFERLVVDLLSKMGYRAFRNARYNNEISGDNLIHGVILEDKSGLNPIYIQAKKSNPEREIGRAELQNFSKVLSDRGGKGLFATTASFSEEAEFYAQDEHLMLIDGNKLAHLMIAKDFCVSVEKVIEIKSIDKESFSDYVR